MSYYQVSLPHYRGSGFLNEAVTRYKMYLVLKLMHKKVFLVPCYDIDLIWHTHQVRVKGKKGLFPTDGKYRSCST